MCETASRRPWQWIELKREHTISSRFLKLLFFLACWKPRFNNTIDPIIHNIQHKVNSNEAWKELLIVVMLCSPSSGCVTGTQARLSAPLQTSHIVVECKFTRGDWRHLMKTLKNVAQTDQVPPLSQREPSIILPGSELEFGVHVTRLKMFVLRWRSGFVHTRKISYTSHEGKKSENAVCFTLFCKRKSRRETNELHWVSHVVARERSLTARQHKFARQLESLARDFTVLALWNSIHILAKCRRRERVVWAKEERTIESNQQMRNFIHANYVTFLR